MPKVELPTVERESGFHAEHGRRVIVERVAEQPGDYDGGQAEAQAGMRDGVFGDGEVEGDPQENARVAGRGVGIPRTAVRCGIWYGFG